MERAVEYYYWATLLYWSLCCVYIFVVSKRVSNKFILIIFKVLPMMLLFYTAFAFIVDHVAPFHIKGPFYMPKIRNLVFGLVVSIIGDTYLVLGPSMFLYGLVAFLGTQVMYVAMFLNDIDPSMHIRAREITVLVLIATVSVVLYVYITRGLGCVLKTATFIYMLFISLMLWGCSVQAMKYPSWPTVAAFVGGISFYCSDVSLALNKWKFRVPNSFIMATYYLAQYLICFSIVNLE